MATPCRHGYTLSSTTENKKLCESPVCVCVCVCVCLSWISAANQCSFVSKEEVTSVLPYHQKTERERNCKAQHVFISLAALNVNKQTNKTISLCRVSLCVCISVCLFVSLYLSIYMSLSLFWFVCLTISLSVSLGWEDGTGDSCYVLSSSSPRFGG